MRLTSKEILAIDASLNAVEAAVGCMFVVIGPTTEGIDKYLLQSITALNKDLIEAQGLMKPHVKAAALSLLQDGLNELGRLNAKEG